MQLKPSILTQPPILHLHDITLFSIKEPVPTLEPYIMVQFLRRQPSPTTQLGPITTLGPNLQFLPTFALLSISTELLCSSEVMW